MEENDANLWSDSNKKEKKGGKVKYKFFNFFFPGEIEASNRQKEKKAQPLKRKMTQYCANYSFPF